MKNAHQLEAQGRRLDRVNNRTAKILELMRIRGATLHVDLSGPRPRWWISTGEQVDEKIAALLVKHRSVIDVGDTLPGCGGLAQTWRYVGEPAD